MKYAIYKCDATGETIEEDSMVELEVMHESMMVQGVFNDDWIIDTKHFKDHETMIKYLTSNRYTKFVARITDPKE